MTATTADEVDTHSMDLAVDDSLTDVTPPELNAATKDVVEWDDAPSSHGHMTTRPYNEEEDSIGAMLVYEGTDEADRERRMAAADPDFEG